MIVGPNQAAGEEMVVNLSARVGYAISAFINIEINLRILFSQCTELPQELCEKMLLPVRNFSTQLDIIDAAVRYKLTSTPALPYWLSLLEYIRELSGDRNFIAHTPITRHVIGDASRAPDPTDPPIEAKIGPHVGKFLASPSGEMETMPLAEVAELIQDFNEAAQFIMELIIAKPRALYDRVSKPIVRRRPSRGMRRGNSPQIQPIRPPSSRPLRNKKLERQKNS